MMISFFKDESDYRAKTGQFLNYSAIFALASHSIIE